MTFHKAPDDETSRIWWRPQSQTWKVFDHPEAARTAAMGQKLVRSLTDLGVAIERSGGIGT